MYSLPRAGEQIDFNNYAIWEIGFTVDPTGNTFVNAPIVLTSTFTFTNVRAYDGNTSIQTITVPEGAVIYTREYDFITQTFSAWNNPSAGSSGATALQVTSSDGSVAQIGASTYNPLTQTISVDLQATGGIAPVNGTATQPILAGQMVYQAVGTTNFSLLQANAALVSTTVGMAITGSAVIGGAIQVQVSETVTNSAWTLQPGKNVYSSPTVAGGVTQTPPTVGQYSILLGTAVTPTSINLQLSNNGIIF